jgi:hypothetical protein
MDSFECTITFWGEAIIVTFCDFGILKKKVKRRFNGFQRIPSLPSLPLSLNAQSLFGVQIVVIVCDVGKSV